MPPADRAARAKESALAAAQSPAGARQRGVAMGCVFPLSVLGFWATMVLLLGSVLKIAGGRSPDSHEDLVIAIGATFALTAFAIAVRVRGDWSGERVIAILLATLQVAISVFLGLVSRGWIKV